VMNPMKGLIPLPKLFMVLVSRVEMLG